MKQKNLLRSLMCTAVLCASASSQLTFAYTLEVAQSEYNRYQGSHDGNQFFFNLNTIWDEVSQTNILEDVNVNDLVVNNTSIEFPDKIIVVSSDIDDLLNKEIDVVGAGIWIVYDESPISYVIPATFKSLTLYNHEIQEVKFEGSVPPIVQGDDRFKRARFIVPSAAVSTYRQYCNDNVDGWSSDFKVIRDDFASSPAISISASAAGNLESELNSVIEAQGISKEDVYHLVISGEINSRDLNIFYSLPYLCSLDMSSVTGLESMRNCFGMNFLETVKLPNSVTEISPSAFNGCISLKSINLDNIDFIRNAAFQNCSKLQSVSGRNVKDIESYAFENCKSLQSIDFPNVERINWAAFSNSGLKEFHIYENVEYENGILDYSAVEKIYFHTNRNFNNVNNLNKLTDVYLFDPIPGEMQLGDTQVIARLHVPGFSYGSYINHPNYLAFNQVLKLGEDLTSLSVYKDLTIASNESLGSKFDLSLTDGILRNDASGALSIGDFSQNYSLKREYNGEFDEVSPSTIFINNGNITADNVKVTLGLQEGWNFISLPFDVNVNDIVTPEDALWVVREYDGDIRAKRSNTGDNSQSQSAWVNVADNSVMQAGKGYIIHFSSDNGNEFTFPSANATGNNIFNNTDVETPLSYFPSEFSHNESWNLIGNPFASCFDIKQIGSDSQIITVWRGDQHYYDEYGTWRQGTYEAISLTDDEYILAPFESFFIQAAQENSTLSFHKEGRCQSFENSRDRLNIGRKKESSNPDRAIINLHIEGNNGHDKTRLVINEDASADYEIIRDASKFLSSNEFVPQIFMLENNQRLAINERPLGLATFNVGTVFGKESEYKISSDSRNSDFSVILHDALTGIDTDITEQEYKFFAQKGSDASRFSISLENGSNAIRNVESDKCNITFNAGLLSVTTKGEIQVYSLDGQLVANGVDTLSINLPRGLFIVKAGGKTMKVTH